MNHAPGLVIRHPLISVVLVWVMLRRHAARVTGDRVVPDLGWTYQQPLHDATQVRGLIAFFNERLDVTVDGERLERPITPWSSRAGT